MNGYVLVPIGSTKKKRTVEDGWTMVSCEDVDLTEKFHWHIDAPGYVRRSGHYGNTILLHQLIMERRHPGYMLEGFVVDHINRNRLDNRRENLRLATMQNNGHNRKYQRVNRSGITGVEKISKTGYRARIRKREKFIHLGTFKSLEEAKQAYDLAAQEYHGSYHPEER